MTTILLPILLPIVLAALTPFLRRSVRALAALPLVAGVLVLLAVVNAAGASPTTVTQEWVGSFTLDFALDSWRLLLLGFVTLFALMSGLFALSATPRIQRPALFTAAVLLAFSSAAGVVLTGNVLLLLIFWEMFLLALYGSIASGGVRAERVAQKALIIGGASDFLMILGLMAYFSLGGSATFGTPIATGSCATALLAFVLIFLGAGAKAGMYPFHTWIPEAAEAMPAVAFAALPASLEKILGISFLFTLTHRMFVLDHTARLVMLLFGLITVFVVIVPALVEKDLKRALALTAISPVGFMICGMATTEAAGMAGALLYMLTHATYKSGMFFAAGSFEARAGSSSLTQLQGIGRALPWCGWGFVLAFAAAISLPPTGGFMAKELIFEGLLEHGLIPILALLAIGAILNVAVFCRLLGVVLGPNQKQQLQVPIAEGLPALLLGVLAAGSALVFLRAQPVFARLMGEHSHLDLNAVWHVGPLTLVSFAIYILGFMMWVEARSRVESAEAAFSGLRTSPVLGAGLRLAEEKKLDWYEVGLKVVDWLTRLVFRYFERLIDEVCDAIIRFGQSFSRHSLSAVHDGVYANYLSWAVVGLAAVLGMLFLTH
jgi:formate hydrogenlyase subunit 3/multisubunit Na+/H+ antiporter MnhD subunit